MNFKKIISIFLRVSISIALLFFLFRQTDEKALFSIIKNSNKPILLLAFLIFFGNYILCLLRWDMLIKAAKIDLSLKRVIVSFSAGSFFNLFLPSTIGGDFMRSVDLALHTKRPRQVVASVLLDRLSGYIGLVLVALTALLLGREFIREKSVFISIGIITSVLISALLVLFNEFFYSKINKLLYSSRAGKIRDAIRNLHQEIYIFRNQKRVILNNLIVSLMIQIVSPLTFYTIALALGIKINPVYFFIYIPIIGAITLLPISIGGLGLRDATTVFFFASAGVSKNLAFAMSLVSFSFIVIYGSIGGLIYVLTVHHRRLQHSKSPVI